MIRSARYSIIRRNHNLLLFWGIGCLVGLIVVFWYGLRTATAGELVLSAPDGNGKLEGVFVAPEAPTLAVAVIIPGSGPTDHDGNSILGVHAGTYRLLAEGLAAQKIASVRIDKRGMFGSKSATADANAVRVEDYVKDVRAWAAVVRQRVGSPCVWLIGHSEGALIALAAAQRHSDICGVVTIAGPGQPMGEFLRKQLGANPANETILKKANEMIDSLEAGRRAAMPENDSALHALFRPEVQGFLIDLFSYDPRKLIHSLSIPVLIVQGDKDLQVPVSEAYSLSASAQGAKLVILPNTNHVLKVVKTEDAGENIATYAASDLPLAPGVSTAIAGFILEHSSR